MPIYEYKCQDCKANFELLVKSDENIKCLGCGGENLKKKASTKASESHCGEGGCSSCSGCGH